MMEFIKFDQGKDKLTFSFTHLISYFDVAWFSNNYMSNQLIYKLYI